MLYVSNNRIGSFDEVEKLGTNGALEDLLLIGNPIYDKHEDAAVTGSDYRLQVIKRVPSLKKLDGIPVDVDERDAAKAL